MSEVTIQDGKFTAIGKVANEKLNACTKVFDLKGRTVVPGLIDNHNHFMPSDAPRIRRAVGNGLEHCRHSEPDPETSERGAVGSIHYRDCRLGYSPIDREAHAHNGRTGCGSAKKSRLHFADRRGRRNDQFAWQEIFREQGREGRFKRGVDDSGRSRWWRRHHRCVANYPDFRR